MSKLLKLSEMHYIVVDDSEIKQNDIVGEKLLTGGYELFTIQTLNDIDANNQFKVTHSTQPLEKDISYSGSPERPVLGYWEIKQITLSEVEEAIYGYSVDYKLEDFEYERKQVYLKTGSLTACEILDKGISLGFKAHQELVKDKLFTLNEVKGLLFKVGNAMRYKGVNYVSYFNYKNVKEEVDKIIQSLQPKTEWNVEFDKQGKFKLT